MCCRTPTPTSAARRRRRSTPCGSRRGSCGARRPAPATASIWTCGSAILNLPDGQPRDDDGPVFAEPWQAQAFALTVRLHETGAFTWNEWAATLAEELKAGSARGLGAGEHYYEHWLAALERITQKHGLAD